MSARDDYPYTDQGISFLTISKERYETMLAELDELRADRYPDAWLISRPTTADTANR